MTACLPTATELDDCHCKIDGEDKLGAAWYVQLPPMTMSQSSSVTTSICISC